MYWHPGGEAPAGQVQARSLLPLVQGLQAVPRAQAVGVVQAALEQVVVLQPVPTAQRVWISFTLLGMAQELVGVDGLEISPPVNMARKVKL